MAVPRMPGGRRPIDDDLVHVALAFAGVFLIVFFLLLVRLYFDQRAGKTVKLTPVRSPKGVIRAMLDESPANGDTSLN